MTASQCTCPSCHLVFTSGVNGGAVVCPVCDMRFSPGMATPAAAALPVTSQAPSPQPWLLYLAVAVLAGGLGTAAWSLKRAPGRKPAGKAAPVAGVRPQMQDVRESPEPVEPLPAALTEPRPAPASQPVMAVPRQAAAPVSNLAVVPGISPTLARRINAAIARGVAYLRNQPLPQNEEGLLGLTLLECGVSASDPLVARLAASLRARAPQITSTYELSTAIYFLDRLAHPKGETLIRKLAYRLLAGQKPDGTWSFLCSSNATQLPGDHNNTQFAALALWIACRHGIGQAGQAALARTAQHYHAVQTAGGSLDYPTERVPKAGPPPLPVMSLPAQTRTEGWSADTRRSWTGFDEARVLSPTRERNLSDPLANAFWQPPVRYIRSNRCCHPSRRDLLTGVFWKLPSLPATGPQPTTSVRGQLPVPRATPNLRPSNICTTLIALAVGLGTNSGRNSHPGTRLLSDPIVTSAHRHLGEAIAKVPRVSTSSNGSVGLLDGFNDTFNLWSLEQVGTLYDLRRVGRCEWYPWAASCLIKMQRPDGSWKRGYDPAVDTCFALLVLRRSNLAPDLTYPRANPNQRLASALPQHQKNGVARTSAVQPGKQGIVSSNGSRRGLTNPGVTPNPGAVTTEPRESNLGRELWNPAAASRARNPKTP